MLPWLVTMAVWIAATPVGASDVPCIRIVDARQQRVLVQGLRQSSTFTRVARALCDTDAIVYVEVSQVMPRDVAGTCQLVVSTATNRFLRIYLNTRVLSGAEMIAVLAHELEHAAEIGRAPWVRQPPDLVTLQRALSGGRGHSPEAARVERLVLREVLSGRPAEPADLRFAERKTDELACGRAGDAPCRGKAADSATWRGLAASNDQGRATRPMLR